MKNVAFSFFSFYFFLLLLLIYVFSSSVSLLLGIPVSSYSFLFDFLLLVISVSSYSHYVYSWPNGFKWTPFHDFTMNIRWLFNDWALNDLYRLFCWVSFVSFSPSFAGLLPFLVLLISVNVYSYYESPELDGFKCTPISGPVFPVRDNIEQQWQ